jgi:hypothetical protein
MEAAKTFLACYKNKQKKDLSCTELIKQEQEQETGGDN